MAAEAGTVESRR